MKRVVEIEHCWQCPFFKEVNQYALRYICCEAGFFGNTKRYLGDEKEIENFLEDKFLNVCKTEQIG
jgi:hypothetical protein